MKRYFPLVLFIALVFGVKLQTSAQQERADVRLTAHTDSVLINFRQSKWDLDKNIGTNAAALRGIESRLTDVLNDSVYRLRRVTVIGGASPEGSVKLNKSLSEHRAATLFGWFDKFNQLSDLDKTFIFLGRDWEGVLREAEKDPNIPYRDETLALLRTLVNEKRALGGEDPDRSLERMRALRGGVPYKYLYKNIFPAVRASKVIIDYDRILAPEVAAKRQTVFTRDTVFVERVIEVRDTIYVDTCHKAKK